MHIGRTRGRALLVGASLLACGQMASASFIQGTITGGLPGNGVNLNSGTVVYAAAAATNVAYSSYPIQGVTFTTLASTSGVTVAGDTVYNVTAPAYSDEASDPLDQVMKGVAYSGSSFTITCAVTTGDTYSLELLVQEVSDTTSQYTYRNFNVALSGADTVAATNINSPTSEKGGNQGISETENFTALSNSLVMTFTPGTYQPGISDPAPALNAFVLTQTPEPGSLSILGVAAIGLLTRRRRARR